MDGFVVREQLLKQAEGQIEAEMRQATGGMPMPDLGSLLGG